MDNLDLFARSILHRAHYQKAECSLAELRASKLLLGMALAVILCSHVGVEYSESLANIMMGLIAIAVYAFIAWQFGRDYYKHFHGAASATFVGLLWPLAAAMVVNAIVREFLSVRKHEDS